MLCVVSVFGCRRVVVVVVSIAIWLYLFVFVVLVVRWLLVWVFGVDMWMVVRVCVLVGRWWFTVGFEFVVGWLVSF